MIQNPRYDNTLWNPTVAFSLGENAAGDPVAIFICTGEDGKEATLMFPEADYLRGVTKLYEEGTDSLAAAKEHGFDTAAAAIDVETPSCPDDISSITDPEEGA